MHTNTNTFLHLGRKQLTTQKSKYRTLVTYSEPKRYEFHTFRSVPTWTDGFFHVSSRSSPFKDLRQGRQGSFSPKKWRQPKQCLIVREILQIHWTFAFIDFPQKGGVISFTLPETNSARSKTKWMLGRWSFPTLRRFFCLFFQGTIGLYTLIPFKKNNHSCS